MPPKRRHPQVAVTQRPRLSGVPSGARSPPRRRRNRRSPGATTASASARRHRHRHGDTDHEHDQRGGFGVDAEHLLSGRVRFRRAAFGGRADLRAAWRPFTLAFGSRFLTAGLCRVRTAGTASWWVSCSCDRSTVTPTANTAAEAISTNASMARDRVGRSIIVLLEPQRTGAVGLSPPGFGGRRGQDNRCGGPRCG